MDNNEIFLGPYHKQISCDSVEYNNENGEKCKKDEVDKLLSYKKFLLNQPRIEKCVSLSEAEWDENLKLAKVTKIAKNLTKNFTHSLNKSIYLYPEECLYLLEMKNLILKWNGNELSIQNAYSLLLSPGSNCTFKEFRTYSYLVKLGFRVFKYDSNLNNNSCNLKDLTKLPKKLTQKIKNNGINNPKNLKNTQFFNSCSNNNVTFPKITLADWVMVSTPPQCYLPHNIQPNYDYYMFKISVSPLLTEITAMLADYYSKDYIKKPFYEKESVVYDSPTTGMYPVYEKNIPNTANLSADNPYEPKQKKKKLMKINEDCLSVAISMTTSSPSDDLNDKENIEIGKDGLPFKINITTASSLNVDTSNIDKSSSNSEQHKAETFNIVTEDEPILMESNIQSITTTTSSLIVDMSNNDKNYSNCEQHEAETFNMVTENETFFMESSIPNHIRKKLFAIKPTKVKYSINLNSEYCVRYDVYYPNNNFPKKTRSAADFRVIVFEDDLYDFPNICDVNISNPHDNIPTLWSIVNSSSVSFYNVNNIIIPSPTDWKINE